MRTGDVLPSLVLVVKRKDLGPVNDLHLARLQIAGCTLGSCGSMVICSGLIQGLGQGARMPPLRIPRDHNNIIVLCVCF